MCWGLRGASRKCPIMVDSVVVIPFWAFQNVAGRVYYRMLPPPVDAEGEEGEKIHFLLDRWTQEVEKHVQLADVRPAATPGSVRDPSTPRWAHHRPRRTVSIIRSPVSMSCHQGAPGRRGLRPLRRISFFILFLFLLGICFEADTCSRWAFFWIIYFFLKFNWDLNEWFVFKKIAKWVTIRMKSRNGLYWLHQMCCMGCCGCGLFCHFTVRRMTRVKAPLSLIGPVVHPLNSARNQLKNQGISVIYFDNLRVQHDPATDSSFQRLWNLIYSHTR